MIISELPIKDAAASEVFEQVLASIIIPSALNMDVDLGVATMQLPRVG